MNAIRWWLFKRLMALAWLACPEPERSLFKRVWNKGMAEFSAFMDDICENRPWRWRAHTDDGRTIKSEFPRWRAGQAVPGRRLYSEEELRALYPDLPELPR